MEPGVGCSDEAGKGDRALNLHMNEHFPRISMAASERLKTSRKAVTGVEKRLVIFT